MLNILRLLLSKIYCNKGSNFCFTDCIKKPLNVGMHLDVYKISLIQICLDKRY